jgi:hypothetical protein
MQGTLSNAEGNKIMVLPQDPAVASALPSYGRLADEVERCGWQRAPHEALRQSVLFRTFQGGHAAACDRFGNEQGQFLLLVNLESVRLPGDEELFPRFLDLALEERMALALARTLGGVDWVLLLTQGRLELLRLADEVSEYRVGECEDFESALLPGLTALARGRARGGQIGHRQLPGAESLGGWIRHWSLQLAAAFEDQADHVERVIWKWILMLQVTRRMEGGEAAGGGWGLRCEPDEGRWSVGYDAISATEDLCRALESFDQNFPTRRLESEEEPFLARLRRLDETSLIDRLRAELLMHSQNRFEPETVAWLFTDLAREQEGWRREVRGVEPIRKRIQMDGWTVYGPLVLDVGRYGLTAALGDTDRLADYLNELNLFERRRQLGERAAAATRQPDLFCPNPRGIGPTGQLDDGLNYMFGETLRLRGVPGDQRFGVAVTFLLKALALAPRMGWPFLGIDTLDRIFLADEE